MRAHLFSLLALAGASLTPAFAYDGRTVSTATRQSAGEVEDIGMIAESTGVDGKDAKSAPPPAAEPSHFRLDISLKPRFTTNAQLSGDHKSDDFLILPNIEAGYRLPMGEKFALDTVARIESGVYARYTERTFLSYSIQSTFEYKPIANGPRLFLGVEPYRLDRFEGQGRITEGFALSAGTDYGYAFNNGNSLAFIGYTLTDHLTDPQIDARVNHSVTLGYSQALNPRLIAQVYAQYQHDNYQSFDREDDRYIVGASLTYQLDKHFFGSINASLVNNASDERKADYESAGVGLSLTYQY
jgi:hypothetical protein